MIGQPQTPVCVCMPHIIWLMGESLEAKHRGPVKLISRAIEVWWIHHLAAARLRPLKPVNRRAPSAPSFASPSKA